MTHQIILHDFTSGGRKVAPHNAVPQGTTVNMGYCVVHQIMLCLCTWYEGDVRKPEGAKTALEKTSQCVKRGVSIMLIENREMYLMGVVHATDNKVSYLRCNCSLSLQGSIHPFHCTYVIEL